MLTPLIITEVSRVTAHPPRRVPALPDEPTHEARAARAPTHGAQAAPRGATSRLEGLA